MSRLIFMSRLGHRVEHEVRRIAFHNFETTSGSRLQLLVSNNNVFLTGGLARLVGGEHWRVAEKIHEYDPPILLGTMIIEQTK